MKTVLHPFGYAHIHTPCQFLLLSFFSSFSPDFFTLSNSKTCFISAVTHHAWPSRRIARYLSSIHIPYQKPNELNKYTHFFFLSLPDFRKRRRGEDYIVGLSSSLFLSLQIFTLNT